MSLCKGPETQAYTDRLREGLLAAHEARGHMAGDVTRGHARGSLSVKPRGLDVTLELLELTREL